MVTIIGLATGGSLLLAVACGYIAWRLIVGRHPRLEQWRYDREFWQIVDPREDQAA